jgi:hypothetical protein
MRDPVPSPYQSKQFELFRAIFLQGIFTIDFIVMCFGLIVILMIVFLGKSTLARLG